MSAFVLAVAEAVVARDADGVEDALATATERMPFNAALARVLAAEVLGGPRRARWLREALDLYEAHDGGVAIDRVRGRSHGDAAGTERVPPELIGFGVTAREAEILQLVNEGLTNPEIAEKLFLSVRTVESHVSSLLTKLGASSRAGLPRLPRQRPER